MRFRRARLGLRWAPKALAMRRFGDRRDGGWRPFGVPRIVVSRPLCRFAPARCPMNAGSGWLALTCEALVMMGSGVRVPPSASSGSPMDRGISAAARRRRRPLLASVWRPVCPSQSNGWTPDDTGSARGIGSSPTGAAAVPTTRAASPAPLGASCPNPPGALNGRCDDALKPAPRGSPLLFHTCRSVAGADCALAHDWNSSN
jgi:hypothetical protein